MTLIARGEQSLGTRVLLSVARIFDPQLEGARAINMIHDERTEEVIAILDRMDADAYL